MQEEDFYMQEERVVFTALFHAKRGSCCGNKCKHCPYEPIHIKGGNILSKEFSNYLYKNTWRTQENKSKPL